MKPTFTTAVAVMAALAVSTMASAQTCFFSPIQEVTPASGAAAVGFGTSFAVDNGRMVVGAPHEGGTGAVHLFDRVGDSWVEVGVVVAPDPSPGDGFGTVVDIKGDRLAVVAQGADVAGNQDRGAVYVFAYQGGAWVFDGKMWPSNSASLVGPLAQDVAIDGNVVLASAPHFAFVFERFFGNWFETQVLPYPGNGLPNFDIELPVFAVMKNGGVAQGFSKQGASWTPFVTYPSVNGGTATYRIDVDAGRVAMSGSKLLVADALTGTVLNQYPVSCERVSMSGDRVAVQMGATVRVVKLLASGQAVQEVVDLAVPSGPIPYNPLVNGDSVLAASWASTASVLSLYSFKNRTFDPLGDGCPGSGGVTPKLTLGSCSEPGSAVTVSIQAALGGTTGLIFLGTGVTSLPYWESCSFFIASPFPSPLLVPIFGAGPGGGSFQFGGALPLNSPSVAIVFQAFVLDAGVPIGASSTNAVVMSIP